MKANIWKNKTGWCSLEWTQSGATCFKFGFRNKKEAITHLSAGAESVDLAGIPDFVEDAVAQIDRYFAGEHVEFRVKLDFGASTDFQKKIWKATSNIPYGETASYGAVALAAGTPGGARATGNALNSNPVPIIVPCHRITEANGSTGGYATGSDVKKALLELESGNRPDFTRIDFMR